MLDARATNTCHLTYQVPHNSEFVFGDLQPNCTKNDEMAPTLKNQNTLKKKG
jgi:hypothetical protein